MKVIICKFPNVTGVERKVRQLLSREKKRAGNVRIFCDSGEVQKGLGLAGIRSEVLDDFQRHAGADDESSWEKVFELSDEWRAAIGNSSLRYSGSNFLTLERNIIQYVYAVKLSNLLRQVAEPNHGVIILVLTEPFAGYLADLNSPVIRTIRHGSIKSFLVGWLRYRLLYEGYLVLAHAKDYFQRLMARGRAGVARRPGENRPRVLFVVSTPLYARPALAIIAECQRNGLVPSVATDDRTLLPWLRQHSIDYSITPPLSLAFASSLPRLGKALRARRRLRKHVGRLGDCQADESSPACLCKRTLLRELPSLCNEAISGIAFLERVMNKTSPDLVCVMPQSRFLQQLASLVAKQKLGLPTLACSAAWETGDARAFRRHLHADRVAVMGERLRDIYIKSGLPPGRVVATGIAHFDHLFNRNREPDERVLLGCGLNPGKPVIVFATEGLSVTETLAALHGVIGAVLKMKDVQLVVKVHPAEAVPPYQAAAAQYDDPRLHVAQDIDLYVLLSQCQLVIVKYSTVALEAMMIGKPVVVINLSGKPVPVPYAEEGAALGVYKVEDIEPAIHQALYDEEARARLKAGRDKFVRAWAGEPDGKASQRIVNLMKAMIAESRARKG